MCGLRVIQDFSTMKEPSEEGKSFLLINSIDNGTIYTLIDDFMSTVFREISNHAPQFPKFYH